MKNLIIIGSDVYARRVIKCIEALIKSGEEISIKGILDNNEEKNYVKGYKILDKIDNANSEQYKNTKQRNLLNKNSNAQLKNKSKMRFTNSSVKHNYPNRPVGFFSSLKIELSAIICTFKNLKYSTKGCAFGLIFPTRYVSSSTASSASNFTPLPVFS